MALYCPAIQQALAKYFEYLVETDTQAHLTADLVIWREFIATKGYSTRMQRSSLKRLAATVDEYYEGDIRVIRSNRGLEGFIAIGGLQSAGETIEIDEAATAPWNDYYSGTRIRGIGSALLKAVMLEARHAPGVKGIHTQVINQVSAHVVRKNGFKRILGNIFCYNISGCSHGDDTFRCL